jgi:paraquat-inducible protein A
MSALPRAAELGLIACTVCGLVCRNVAGDPQLDGDGVDDAMACPRCASTLRRRKPDSFARTWALLIAAFLMYIPANVLPIMRTASLNDIDDNTIISGVVELWRAGSPNLAVIVFTASIVVPVLKFLALSVLSLVEPLPGVIFFGLTVVLTMFASMSFDPRLIWDGKDSDD